jgi:hypothetical protein
MRGERRQLAAFVAMIFMVITFVFADLHSLWSHRISSPRHTQHQTGHALPSTELPLPSAELASPDDLASACAICDWLLAPSAPPVPSPALERPHASFSTAWAMRGHSSLYAYEVFFRTGRGPPA